MQVIVSGPEDRVDFLATVPAFEPLAIVSATDLFPPTRPGISDPIGRHHVLGFDPRGADFVFPYFIAAALPIHTAVFVVGAAAVKRAAVIMEDLVVEPILGGSKATGRVGKPFGLDKGRCGGVFALNKLGRERDPDQIQNMRQLRRRLNADEGGQGNGNDGSRHYPGSLHSLGLILKTADGNIMGAEMLLLTPFACLLALFAQHPFLRNHIAWVQFIASTPTCAQITILREGSVAKTACDYLYLIMDVYSRKIVGWGGVRV